MSYQPITTAGVAGAQALDFPADRYEDRRSRPQDLTITIKARVDGFDCELCFAGDLEKLHAVVSRLRVLGAEPVSAPQSAPTPATNGKPKVERVEPLYKPDGTACCPTHMKPLQEGRYGLFCPSRAKGDEPANDKGYCNLKFSE